jgi:hypothetical protein
MSYHPLFHDLRIIIESIATVNFTFVIAQPDVFVVGVKSLEDGFLID